VSAQRNPGGLERFLRLFTDIRAGEAGEREGFRGDGGLAARRQAAFD